MARELLLPGKVRTISPPLGTHCFNGGLVAAWGKLLTVYRVNRRPSLLAISELDDVFEAVETKLLWDTWDPILIPEDPRVILHGQELFVFWTGVNGVTFDAATICQGTIDADYCLTSKSPCWYQHAGKIEKNWLPFVHKGQLHCIYWHDPLTILRFEGGAWRLVYVREEEIRWQYGTIFGGAPPVWRNGLWYVFFHSARHEANKVKVYYAGCYALDASWNLVGITEEPILAGSARSYTKPWSANDPGVSAVFPCGAVARGGDWLISYGYLDSELRIAAVPQAAVDEAIGLPMARR